MTFEAVAPLLQVALKAVSNLLLRANSELRHLYDLYSSRQLPGVATSAAQLRHSRALTTGHFWAMMRDARVLDVDCSLANISRAAAEVSLGRWCGQAARTASGPTDVGWPAWPALNVECGACSCKP